MDYKIAEIAQRLATLREIEEISQEEMAQRLGVSLEEYTDQEDGKLDFSFTFLYKCAAILGVDMIEILTGEKPKLSFYSIVRKGHGIPIKRRRGFTYSHIGHLFKDKMAEPLFVHAPYSEEEQNKPISLSYHKGQEFDYILKGSLKVAMEKHIEILHEGDAIFYDSGHGHGMIATGGEDCDFIAIIIKSRDTQDE